MENNEQQVSSPASALIGDPSRFGRVAEDGTVFVQTPEGERAVGSYPGKTAEEALAYFVRKFEVVAAEVALLAARIVSGAMVPEDALQSVAKLRNQIDNLNGVGNLVALRASLEQIPSLIEDSRPAFEARKAADQAAKAEKRAAALSLKEQIVSEAESLKESTQWKVTSERLKELLDQWKKAPRLDKKSDADLWKRFSSARNFFDKKRRQHFSNLTKVQSEVKGVKERIVAEAETLVNSTDWVNTARKYKSLMDSWKAAGRGKKNDDDKLWLRFKKAQDTFFAAKNADLEKRSASFGENLLKREELVKEIEGLLPISNLDDTRRKFRDLKSKYMKSGQVERGKRNALDRRVDDVELTIKEAEQEQWRKSDPGAKARAAEVVAQLVAAVADYENKAAKAQAAGDTRKASELREAAAARSIWLAEAQKGLSEFTN